MVEVTGMEFWENPILPVTSVPGIGTVAQHDGHGVRAGQTGRNKRIRLGRVVQFEGTDVVAISRKIKV